MKVIILAGGYGSRLGSLTEYIPKPMVKIGDRPILWHIMKNFSTQGFSDFVLSLGYKGDVIREYFYNYHTYTKDFTINLASRDLTLHSSTAEDWNVTCVDTGLNSLKGARVKRIGQYLDDDTNILTYGDGVADIDIARLLDFHHSHGRLMTVTGVHPPSMFGEIDENNGLVTSFSEKSQMSKGLINGGFMVFHKKVLDYLSEDESCDLEIGPMEELSRQEQVMVYKHTGSWYCMDQRRDHEHLTKLWKRNNAFWKNWA